MPDIFDTLTEEAPAKRDIFDELSGSFETPKPVRPVGMSLDDAATAAAVGTQAFDNTMRAAEMLGLGLQSAQPKPFEVLEPIDPARTPEELSARNFAAQGLLQSIPRPPVSFTPPELKPATTGERIAMSPIGERLGLGRSYERELQRNYGGGSQGVMPMDLVDTAFKFTTVPPQIAQPIRNLTDPALQAMGGPDAGVVQGLREFVLNFPLPVGAAVSSSAALEKAVMGVFAGDFVLSQPERYAQFKERLAAGDMKGAAAIATEDVAMGLVMGAGGIGMVRGKPETPAEWAGKSLSKLVAKSKLESDPPRPIGISVGRTEP